MTETNHEGGPERATTTAQFDPKGQNPVTELAAQGGGCLGFVLCLTIVGAVVGLPMILADLRRKKTGSFTGKCPHCDSKLVIYGDQEGVDCRTCKGRVVRKDDVFHAF